MRGGMLQPRRRAMLIGLLALIGLLSALWPGMALAQDGDGDDGFCSIRQPATCLHAIEYNAWEGVALQFWGWNQSLLILAYQLDSLRFVLLDTIFLRAYDVLEQTLGPLLTPIATVAVLLALLAVIVAPIIRVPGFHVWDAIVWTLVAFVLLPFGGQMVVHLEQTRSDVGSLFFTSASETLPGTTFGARPEQANMATPDNLYAESPCTLSRPSSATVSPLVPADDLRYADDLAAALLYADGADIHCLDDVRREGNPGLPEGWFEETPGWAVAGGLGGEDTAAETGAAAKHIRMGVQRSLMALVPSFLAVLVALVNLLFTLCMVLLGILLPIGLIGNLFPALMSGIGVLVRQAVEVLKVSWASSFVLGFTLAGLTAAAELQNAAVFIGLSWGALCLVSYLLLVAFRTVGSSLRAANSALSSVTGGLTITEPILVTGAVTGMAVGAGATAVGVAGGAAVGAGKAAGTFGAAKAASGSTGYAAGAVLGRTGGVRKLAEVGRMAGMGRTQTSPLLEGIDQGYRARRESLRGARRGGEQFALKQRQQRQQQSCQQSDPGGQAMQRAAERFEQAAQGMQRLISAQERGAPTTSIQQRQQEVVQHFGAAKRDALAAAQQYAPGSTERKAWLAMFRNLADAQQQVRAPVAAPVQAPGQPAYLLVQNARTAFRENRQRLQEMMAAGNRPDARSEAAGNVRAMQRLSASIGAWRAQVQQDQQNQKP